MKEAKKMLQGKINRHEWNPEEKSFKRLPARKEQNERRTLYEV